jgi:hypothetical protein
LLTKPSMFGKFLVDAWRFEQRTFYIGSWRAKLFLALLSTLPPRMHQRLTKHGRFCKKINQLPTKSCVELKDNLLSAKVRNRESTCKSFERLK